LTTNLGSSFTREFYANTCRHKASFAESRLGPFGGDLFAKPFEEGFTNTHGEYVADSFWTRFPKGGVLGNGEKLRVQRLLFLF
jgi:hypothetical protein